MLKRLIMGTVCAAALLTCGDAYALTRDELRDVGFHLVPGTSVPPRVALLQPGGETTMAAALAGKPALLVFTDYRCQSLCGIVLDQLADLVPRVGLTLGRDYNILSVALDAAQTPADAMAFRDAHTAGSSLRDGGLFFAEGETALEALRASVGLVAPFDAEHRQFAHPAGLVVIDAEGKAQRILSPFALDPFNLKLALTDGGAAPSFVAHALLLCYGWNPVAGVYTLRIERILMTAGAATIALIGLAVAGLLYRERRAARRPALEASKP